MVTNWNHLETIWRHAFCNELCICPEEHHILLTEAPIGPKANRERLTSMMFETFKVPGIYMALAAVLALYPSGRSTGLVVDSGENMTHIVPIYEGYAMPHAILRRAVGGSDLTSLLSKLLTARGHDVSSKTDLDNLRRYKEEQCYVALDFDAEISKVHELEAGMGLPEYEFGEAGRYISLGSERFCCPEALFQPRLFGGSLEEMSGLHVAVFDTIRKCDCDIRRDLYRNIVLAGGCTMFQGMQDRLARELVALAPTNASVEVIASPARQYAAWAGGSIFASVLECAWITKDDFDKAGPGIVHRLV
eukprot:TRINITY_DN87832_c0_g1_i1.p1 TRINITY_DN87832_c0_g1~~TRINITY_DN87832_c0_g1_i1.p1  ORF type:complete len:305 (-),score=43.17 TRINITY_DN87832_c0_g1_i1:108-1022(-)